MTRRSSRSRRVLKWSGLAATVVVVVGWVVSTNWEIAYRDPGSRCVLLLSEGAIYLWYNPKGWKDLLSKPFHEGWSAQGEGWRMTRESARIGRWDMVADLLGFKLPTASLTSGSGRATVLLPLWVILVAVAGLTSLFWWLDQRHPAGHCQACGYDLTGNVSGVCPECGAAAG